MVVIDTLVDIFGGADENSAREVNPIMMALSYVAKRTKAAIVLLHHTNREGNYRGSSALMGAVDLMLQVKKSRGLLEVSAIKARDIDDQLFFMAVPSFEKGFSLSIQKAGRNYIQDAALEFVQANPNCTVNDVLIGLEKMVSDGTASITREQLKPGVVRANLNSLIKQQKIIRSNKGGKGSVARYSIVE